MRSLLEVMDEEKGEDQGRSNEEMAATTMKFSFTASKPKFSASRPPLFPKGKPRNAEALVNRDVEFVTAFDGQGVVSKDPRGVKCARVIPKLENSWRPEKRMKNIMMETDIMAGSDERFEKEEMVIGEDKPASHYGLTMGVKKVETMVEDGETEGEGERHGLTMTQLEEQRLREDLLNLPDEANMDVYEDMPIEDFGEAILRGMGWEKGKPIGRNCKVAVVPVEYVRRSGRTGLGAEPAPKEVNNARQIKPGESRLAAPDLVASVGQDGRVRNVVTVDEKLVERAKKGVAKGKVMSIISGRHLGLRGEVLNCENLDRVCVRLLKSEEKVLVTAKDLADIGSVEEEKVLKQIRELRIGNGEASRREVVNEDYEKPSSEDVPPDGKEERYNGRKEDRREGRREKDTRREERVDNGSKVAYRREDEERSRSRREDEDRSRLRREDEDRSRSRRDSRRDERGSHEDQRRTSRNGRRERKVDEYDRPRDDMEVDEEGVGRTEERRSSVTEHNREERKDEGRRESNRRDGRREEERSLGEHHGRSHRERDERGVGRDRKGNDDDTRLSEDMHEKGRRTEAGGSLNGDDYVQVPEGRCEDTSWLRSQIRVRIVSKTLRGGRFYLRKGRIVDVVTPRECDIVLDESGEVLQQVRQDHLETALPKRGGRVMVVGGEHCGLLGKLIKRDSEGEVGLVQMEETFDMVTLSLDLLAEFVGDASERDF